MSPKTKDQFEQIRKKSKAKILGVALNFFGTQGYQNTSISEITKLAGVSKGLMYHYCLNKEELIKQLLLDVIEETDELLFLISHTPTQELENMLKSFFKFLRDDFEKLTLWVNQAMQLDKFDFVRDLCNTKMDESISFIEKLLVKLKWPDPNGEAKILLLLLDGISIQYLWFKQDYHLDKFEKVLLNKYSKK